MYTFLCSFGFLQKLLHIVTILKTNTVYVIIVINSTCCVLNEPSLVVVFLYYFPSPLYVKISGCLPYVQRQHLSETYDQQGSSRWSPLRALPAQ